MNSLELFTFFTILFCVSIIRISSSANVSKNSARKPRFISFDSDGGKIDIDLDLSIPFLSIPLDNEAGSDGRPGPLLNVNTKAITVAGLMAAITAFIVPLFFKTPSDHRYRLHDDFGFSEMTNTMNNLILGNNYVTPCIQRAVCTLVSKSTRTNNPTSTDKIVDTITSNKWFEGLINGTAIEEAVLKGRETNRGCSFIYKDCTMPGKIFDNLLDELENL